MTRRYVDLGPDAVRRMAEEVLGHAPVRPEPDGRGWLTFYCPFHHDVHRPNFGVNVTNGGQWKCLACGVGGTSVLSLAAALGRRELIDAWRREGRVPEGEFRPRAEEDPPPSPVPALAPAVALARRALWSGARSGRLVRRYLERRGVPAYLALLYGLGAGSFAPDVPRDVTEAALAARLAVRGRRDPEGAPRWLWANAAVYADPPSHPTVIVARLVKPRRLPGGRELRYLTWGRGRTRPLGAWLVSAATHTLAVVEGVFDMLALAKALFEVGRFGPVLPVALGGAPPAAVMRWLAAWPGELVLVPDADEAGRRQAEEVVRWRRAAGREAPLILVPPEGQDPDEALAAGWRPAPLLA